MSTRDPLSHPRFQQAHEDELLLRLDDCNRFGVDALTARETAQDAVAERILLDRAAPDDVRGLQAVATRVLFLLAIPAAYCIDTLILAPTGEDLATRFLSDSVAARIFVRLAAPAAVILMELFIGYGLHSSSPRVMGLHYSRSRHLFWLAAAILMAFLMPLAVYAAFSAEHGSPIPADVRGQFLLFLLFAMVFHLPLIFGGGELSRGKQFLAYRIECRRISSRENTARLEEARAISGLRTAFTRLCFAVENRTARFGLPFNPAMIDARAAMVLRELFPGHWLLGDYTADPRAAGAGGRGGTVS